MQIILKKDVQNLGYIDDILEVKDGYARNYLIPQGFAIAANDSNKKILSEVRKQRAFKIDKIRNEASAEAKLLDGLTVKIATKAAASGKIYGSVNAIQIAEAIKEQHNYDVDRKKITIEGETIKEVGTYKATAQLYKDIVAEITFEVVTEE
ncbi:MAG: 50S ribosomal protein L9 [Bacteroidales bacterium]|jgi:large subunit ribosomal protein L9|nr:50S ribosomal protein L9 [Bacteroidales bacterium]